MKALDQLTAAAMMETTVATLHGLSNNDDFTEEQQEVFADARDLINQEILDGDEADFEPEGNDGN